MTLAPAPATHGYTLLTYRWLYDFKQLPGMVEDFNSSLFHRMQNLDETVYRSLAPEFTNTESGVPVRIFADDNQGL